MRFAALILLAATLGVACSVLVACGGSNDDNLIPGRDAEALKRYADRVGTAVGQQDCAEAQTDVARAIKRIGALPATVDPDLRANLEEGFNNLARQAETQCQGTTTTDTTTTETQPTETTDTTTTETTDTTTTDTTTTDTTTTDTTTTDTTPTNGDGTGGSGSGDQGGSGSGDQGGTPAGGAG
jgi:hypothetical protein